MSSELQIDIRFFSSSFQTQRKHWKGRKSCHHWKKRLSKEEVNFVRTVGLSSGKELGANSYIPARSVENTQFISDAAVYWTTYLFF